MPQGLRCSADEGRLKLEKGFVLLSLSLLLFFVRWSFFILCSNIFSSSSSSILLSFFKKSAFSLSSSAFSFFLIYKQMVTHTHTHKKPLFLFLHLENEKRRKQIHKKHTHTHIWYFWNIILLQGCKYVSGLFHFARVLVRTWGFFLFLLIHVGNE